MRKTILLVLSSLLLVSCRQPAIYSEFRDMPLSGWHEDSVLHYALSVSDTIDTYDILLTVRHTAQYPYQNLWMFVSEWQDSVCLTTDTIECYLADDRGRWLGAGISTYEMPLLYVSDHRFPHEGDYTFTLRHGMRMENLRGIRNIGLKIQEHHGKE